MMGQRKLNSEQIRHADEASKNIARISAWDEIDGGDAYWRDVHRRLRAMATHGTTDGKPYIEPQPQIGEGYRLATKADAQRLDREGWLSNERGWLTSLRGVVAEGVTYRVPIDHIPTDEDAKQRPTVMMAKDGICFKAILLAVCPGSYWQFCGLSEGAVVLERECRFPYPGELD